MHTSTTVSKSTTVLGFFRAISSIVLISLTSSQKALMISMSQRLSSCFYLMVFRVSAVDERSYVP
jgi:hypothetical protein